MLEIAGVDMRKKLTDKEIQRFFWEADELPFDNKASSMLGDLTQYGVSRCKKLRGGWKGVWYEFDVYRNGDFLVILAVELPTDFTLKDIEKAIDGLHERGGMLASNDLKTFRKWKRDVLPKYSYDHAKYSALRFLEALKKRLIQVNV